mmetsp:Transcript_15674/g.31352  ORF Transcript_15674/g.31352 Transcript_15674/m.31352 type:complete len:202 (-) Transcript_15674:18-623(-)
MPSCMSRRRLPWCSARKDCPCHPRCPCWGLLSICRWTCPFRRRSRCTSSSSSSSSTSTSSSTSSCCTCTSSSSRCTSSRCTSSSPSCTAATWEPRSYTPCRCTDPLCDEASEAAQHTVSLHLQHIILLGLTSVAVPGWRQGPGGCGFILYVRCRAVPAQDSLASARYVVWRRRCYHDRAVRCRSTRSTFNVSLFSVVLWRL